MIRLSSVLCLLASTGCGAASLTTTTTTTLTDTSSNTDGLSQAIAQSGSDRQAVSADSNSPIADGEAACTADAAASAGSHALCLCGTTAVSTPPSSGSKGGGSCHEPPSIGRHHTLALRCSQPANRGDCGSKQHACVAINRLPTDPNAASCPCAPSEAEALTDDIGEAAADANVTIAVLDANHLGTAITLAAGYYTVPSIKTQRSLSIVANGAVRLYVQGDVQVHGALALSPGNAGSLQVWVGGRVNIDGSLQAGLLTSPAATRLYVAGNQIALGRPSRIDGQLFAPIAAVWAPRGLQVHGSLLAATVKESGTTSVCYDDALSAAPFSCAAPVPPMQPTQPTQPSQPVTPPTNITCGACNFDCGALTCGSDVTCVPCNDATPCCNGRICQAGNCTVNN